GPSTCSGQALGETKARHGKTRSRRRYRRRHRSRPLPLADDRRTGASKRRRSVAVRRLHGLRKRGFHERILRRRRPCHQPSGQHRLGGRICVFHEHATGDEPALAGCRRRLRRDRLYPNAAAPLGKRPLLAAGNADRAGQRHRRLRRLLRDSGRLRRARVDAAGACVIGTIAVSMGALRHNATLLRDAIAPTRAAFVVKGNAYGHGLIETALAAEPFAARLCVFSIEEALALRDGGITASILVLGPVPPEALSDALRIDAEIALWNTNEYLRALAGAARERFTRARVHVKINTDLNRLGLEPHELVDALEEYLRHPEIEIAGIYSHLASAEEIDSPYTMHQLEAFDRALTQAKPLLDSREIA